ncbi:MAG TPA: hypothetical protein VEH76_15405 [Methylocystis sp.]|nr:hypothetical protein [Methylocystis sp.]
MATWHWSIYNPPEKRLPYLVVLITGSRIKKVEYAIPAKTADEAEAILKTKIAEGAPNVFKSPLIVRLEKRGRELEAATEVEQPNACSSGEDWKGSAKGS